MALIRDHWVDRQLSSHREAYSQRQTLRCVPSVALPPVVDLSWSRLLYRLRIGTFNVNGKPPVQSLVPWVWASSSRSDSVDIRSPQDLPKQEGLHELSDIDPSLPNASSDDDPKLLTTDILDSSSVDNSTAASFGVQSSKDTLAQSPPPSSIISGNDEDLPDIFVLGFQELDHSPEALIYSTSTLKADSWISCIFTALGENAVNYTKVCHRLMSTCGFCCNCKLEAYIVWSYLFGKQLASKQLVGVLVIVIIRKELQSMVKEVSTGSAGVGLMGIMVSSIHRLNSIFLILAGE